MCVGSAWAQELAIPAAAPAHVLPALAVMPRSVVYTITNPGLADGGEASPDEERQMVDRLVAAVTGEQDKRKAWSKLVKPTDVVGIKISTVGGRFFSTHHGVVAAVVSGLQSAGVPPEKIIIWDRQSEPMREAGFIERRGGPRVRAIDPPRGFDSQAVITAPALGLLIWGDVSFRGIETGKRRLELAQSQNSSESHLAKIVSQEVTKIINLPTFSDVRGAGVAGALYNVTVPNLDNNRRFAQGAGPSSIVDVYNDPRIGPKVVLTIVDGLRAQFAGGPDFNPNYAYAYRTLLASKDPVALDSTIYRKLEEWRKEARLPSIERESSWLQEAETMGIGTYEESRIVTRSLSFP